MKNKIGLFPFCSLLIMISLSSFLGVGIISSIKIAGKDNYIVIPFAFIFGIIIFLVNHYISIYEPDLTLHEKTTKILGKKFGLIINILFIINTFLLGSYILFDLINYIVSQILQQTPLLLIAILFLGVIIYGVKKGINNITNISMILMIINLTLFLTAILNLIPNIEYDNYLPILEHGIKSPIVGGIYLALYDIVPIYIMLSIPHNRIANKNKIGKYFILSYILVFILKFLVLFITLGNMGIELMKLYQYPEYIVLKKINFFNFIERIENVINIQWIFGLYVFLTMVVYYLSNSIKIKKNNISIYLIAFIILSLTFLLFKNTTNFYNYIDNYLIYINATILFIQLILCLIIFIKKKRKE